MTIEVKNRAGAGAADWGSVNDQSRLTIPSEITDQLSWFTPKKTMPVLLDLCKPKIIVIRYLPSMVELLAERRRILREESEAAEIGLRRVAMTFHYFREASLVVPERRIGLKAVVLDHLETKPGGKLFCLGFSDLIEVYSEPASRELIDRYASDASFGIQNNG